MRTLTDVDPHADTPYALLHIRRSAKAFQKGRSVSILNKSCLTVSNISAEGFYTCSQPLNNAVISIKDFLKPFYISKHCHNPPQSTASLVTDQILD